MRVHKISCLCKIEILQIGQILLSDKYDFISYHPLKL